MNVQFEQIRIEPAYRKVAAAIIERIVSRSLRDGDRLPPEMELARQFGVNRSTVREALRELESNGLLARQPGSRRMTVTRPPHNALAEGISRALVLHDVTFLEVWEALTVIEPPIAESAAQRRETADVDCLSAAAERFASDNADADRAVRHVTDYFHLLARATRNQVLQLAQEPLLRLLGPSLRIMIDKVPQARTRIATAQRRICDAIRQQDAAGARDWMARHIRDFRKGYELAQIDLQHRIVAG